MDPCECIDRNLPPFESSQKCDINRNGFDPGSYIARHKRGAIHKTDSSSYDQKLHDFVYTP